MFIATINSKGTDKIEQLGMRDQEDILVALLAYKDLEDRRKIKVRLNN
jgi:hypothetical protein